MKRIEFISPADGDVIINPDILMLKILFLYVGGEFWNSGSGDSCMEYFDENKKSRLEILFSDSHGFYLRYQARGQDFHTLNIGDHSKTTQIYVGGNPLMLPIKFFIDREKAFDVLTYFCETGDRLQAVTWEDNEKIEWDGGKYPV